MQTRKKLIFHFLFGLFKDSEEEEEEEEEDKTKAGVS